MDMYLNLLIHQPRRKIIINTLILSSFAFPPQSHVAMHRLYAFYDQLKSVSCLFSCLLATEHNYLKLQRNNSRSSYLPIIHDNGAITQTSCLLNTISSYKKATSLETLCVCPSFLAQSAAVNNWEHSNRASLQLYDSGQMTNFKDN